MHRLFSRRSITFLGILVTIGFCYFLYTLFINSSFVRSFQPIGDSSVSITTWLDTNGNGILDQGESPLPNVCVGYFNNGLDELIRRIKYPCTQADKTDAHGQGGSDFLAGWTGDIYKYAFPPDGYQPTTDMISLDYFPKFGFAPKDIKVYQRVETVDGFIRKELIKLGLRYIAITFFVIVTAMYVTIKIEKDF